MIAVHIQKRLGEVETQASENPNCGSTLAMRQRSSVALDPFLIERFYLDPGLLKLGSFAWQNNFMTNPIRLKGILFLLFLCAQSAFAAEELRGAAAVIQQALAD